ncbi:membrane protein [Microbacterium phage HitchHiker]
MAFTLDQVISIALLLAGVVAIAVGYLAFVWGVRVQADQDDQTIAELEARLEQHRGLLRAHLRAAPQLTPYDQDADHD